MDEIGYPKVVGEYHTVREILKGKSIARFGDGELKMMECKGYVRENADVTFAEEIRRVMWNPHKDCLVGIPTMDPDGPKFPNWSKHAKRFMKYIERADEGMVFYSAFISRPDSAPWIERQKFVDLLLKLWAGKRATIVCEQNSKLLTAVKRTAAAVTHIECPSHGAYEWITHYERRITNDPPEVAILSCGPTATCLANRLAKRGVQALDMGSIGGFLLRWMKGDPKPESYAKERL